VLRDRAGARPLDAGVRSALEPRFGHDFSRVRVHDDAPAAALAGSAGARAFTIGDDVVFGAGQYAPASPAGLRRIAHELAHVVQGRNGGGPAPAAESRAERAADTVTRGRRADAAALGGPPAGLAREPETGKPGLGAGLRLHVATFGGFGPTSAALTPAHLSTVRSTALLLTGWVLRDPSARFPVVGRAGAGAAGRSLAWQRAMAVVRALRKEGVPATALLPDTSEAVAGDAQVEIQAPATAGTPAGGTGASAPSTGVAGPESVWTPPRPPIGGPGPAVPPVTPPTGGPALGPPPSPWSTPPGEWTAPTRAATGGDAAKAVVKMTVVENLIEQQKKKLLGGVERTLKGPDVVPFVAGVATVGTGFGVTATAGLLGSAELRKLVVENLDGVELPLAGLADLKFQLPLPLVNAQIDFDLPRYAPITNEILRAGSVRFQSMAKGELRLPAGTHDIGFIFLIDLAKLRGAGVLK
jgi:hypothetical protein